MSDTIPAHSTMIVSAFRYCLGRRTSIVSECSKWLVDNWPSIPADARFIIHKELEEAFEWDNANPDADYKRLGDTCDRAAWARVRSLYRPPTCCQCGKEIGADRGACIHADGEMSCSKCFEPNCVICGEGFNILQTFIPVGRARRHPGCPANPS